MRYFVLIFFTLFSITVYGQQGTPTVDTSLISKLVRDGESCYMQQPDTALAYWKKALVSIEAHLKNDQLSPELTLKLKGWLGASLNGMAFIFQNQGDVPKALDHNHRALKIREEISDKNGIAESLNNIGVIYDYQNEGDKALEYYERSLKVLKEIGEKRGISTLLNNMGFVYNLQGHPDKAIEYYEKALAINIELNNQYGIAESYNNIGALYRNKGEYAKALELFDKSLGIRLKIKDKRGIANSYKNLCDHYLRQKKYDKALDYGNKSLSVSTELGYPEAIMNAALKLNLIYRETGDYKKALENYELSVRMRDSISNEKTRKATLKTQIKYEYEKKAVADSIRVNEQKKVLEATISKQRTQRTALYTGIVLIALFSAVMYSRFRIIRKQKQLLEIKEKETNEQKTIIEDKHKAITDSINYARRIQQSLLPQQKYIARSLERLQNKKKG